MASAKSAWRRVVQLNRKIRRRLVMRQCSISISALGTCCSRILDREQFSIIWVFVAFLMLPNRVPTYQSETRNQHVVPLPSPPPPSDCRPPDHGLHHTARSIPGLFPGLRNVSSVAYNLIGWHKRYMVLSFSPSVSWARQSHLTFSLLPCLICVFGPYLFNTTNIYELFPKLNSFIFSDALEYALHLRK